MGRVMEASQPARAFENPQRETRTELTPERFREIRGLFEAALDVDQEERSAWVREACKGDAELYVRVEEMLRADRLAGEGDPLTQPLTVSRDEAAVPRLEG